MKTPYKLAICVLSPLLLASIALGQQDYIGRYDLYAGYMYLNSPGLSLARVASTRSSEPIRRNGIRWVSISAREPAIPP